MKILVVEDEPKRQGLSEAGFTVDLARDGKDAVHIGTTDDYDLIVLDVMLPGRDGWPVLRALREAGKSMPVLFLTARDRVEDRVKGLELGADDILSNRSRFRSCSRGPCYGAARPWNRRCPGLPTWSSTSIAGA